MLTHFGNFLCSLGGKGPFKTNAALWSAALREAFFLFFSPFYYRFVSEFLFKDLAPEQENGVTQPQSKEDAAGDAGLLERIAGKFQQEQQRRDHHHRREIGQDVQTGGGGLQARIHLFHQNHTVGGRSRQRTEAHKEEFMLKALEAFP